MIAALPATRPSLAAGLRKVYVGLREDLEVTRHVFRGAVSYVVRDPMTFQSQRLDAGDYAVLAAIRADRSLSDTFADLVARGTLDHEEEDRFYQFVVLLHRLGFLRLPIADDKAIYRRYQLRRKSAAKQKLMSFLFLRVPILNPNAFLDRTIHLARFLFSRAFFVFWLMLVAAAICIGASRWDALRQPFDGVLLARNLPLLWLTLVGLKVFHEFGHAYACKHYGGHVPEMGAYFILFTPCAYMDATACWGFTRKRERLIVCLGGMYIESIFASIAVFVWALTDPSIVNSIAYNVIFLASVVTILFNINPLMRYDGYYILSDLTEIPNLRSRADQHILAVAKRLLLGLKRPVEPGTRRLRTILLAYGIAAFLYRLTLLISIAVVLAAKVFLLGLVFAVAYLGMSVLGALRRLMRYLWHAEETGPVRVRAVTLGVLLLVIIPTLLVIVHIPSSVHAAGIVAAEREVVLRARTPGFLQTVAAQRGERVSAGDPIAELTNDAALEALAEHTARVRSSELRRDALRVVDPVKALQEESEGRAQQAALTQSQEKLAELTVRSGLDGQLLNAVTDSQIGRYYREGDPLGLVASGPWLVRAVVTDEQLARMAARVGDSVTFQAAATSRRALAGRVTRIAPAGSRTVDL
ncbi:MAG: efflux RND transporter periplasmic adaptor subunit, partial [Phycisphaerales bacterium]|nr:efflux RND transporter periplasmic adaptor subunit [Phycisphaerales bacterium]